MQPREGIVCLSKKERLALAFMAIGKEDSLIIFYSACFCFSS